MRVKLTPKQYLKQGYRLDELIKSDVEELELLNRSIDGVSSFSFDKEPVQNGDLPSSPTERSLFKIEALKEKINREIDDFIDLKDQIREAINSMTDPDERLILRSRYILFKSWDEIQVIVKRERAQTFALHQSALNHFKVPDGKFSFKTVTKSD